MSTDQLAEYRRSMQARYGNRPNEEEKKEPVNRDEQIKRDEELARKLSGDHPYHAENANTGYGQSYPPPPQNYYNAPTGYYQSSYPPPNPSYYQNSPYPPGPANHNEREPLNNRSDGFLPEVKDTCCYVNSQVCVLTLAVLMIAGIIAGVVVVAVG